MGDARPAGQSGTDAQRDRAGAEPAVGDAMLRLGAMPAPSSAWTYSSQRFLPDVHQPRQPPRRLSAARRYISLPAKRQGVFARADQRVVVGIQQLRCQTAHRAESPGHRCRGAVVTGIGWGVHRLWGLWSETPPFPAKTPTVGGNEFLRHPVIAQKCPLSEVSM